ncbi:hypothetical protein GCM10025870_16610 [Agromyces marinus]|uniref:SIP-like Rossmann fold domain-containing protein n=1 Tax=Agromyces marinus TaxID=1389020 RepID=A0ABM8H1D5_9MICO|nr:siderophore-interacting protein [Agromyces marinus]BDZ54588.1 hypothetical protein GCM10025870_16610 [Agromyces marinus]
MLHEHGVGGRWAARAPLGSPVGVGGPRGSMLIEGTARGWFLAGDETAIPAIRRLLAELSTASPHGAGLVLIEVPDEAHRPVIEAPPGAELRWVHRGAAPAGSALVAAVDALTSEDRPAPTADPAEVFAFIAAEHTIVKPGRALVLDRWGLDPDRVVVKGYWRRGEDEYHAPH